MNPKRSRRSSSATPTCSWWPKQTGKLIGTVIGGFDGRRGLIYHLAVEAAFRQQGIGSLLMDEVERRLKAKGCLKCYLMVTVDNDKRHAFL